MRESDAQMMAKYKFKFKQTVWAVSLLCAVTSASGLTIERASGSVVLGRPFDLTVKVSVAPDEDLAGLCASAEVSYGDVLQDPGRVTVSTEPSSTPQTLNVRIRASNPVDEPMVLLEVKAGCKQTVSRRFVLLSDLSPDIQRTVAASVTQQTQPVVVSSVVAPLAPSINLKDGNFASAPDSQVFGQKPTPVPSVVRIKPKASSVAVPSGENAPGTQRSLLKLAPIDLSQDWDPILQVTSEILTLPVEDLNKRREAAALWRYLNLSPKDMLRINAQEDEFSQLKILMGKSQQQMQELNQQLQNAEDQRYSNPLVYTLAALILLMLGGAGFVYHRMGGRGIPSAQWWKNINSANDFRASEFSESDDLSLSETKPVLPASASSESSQGGASASQLTASDSKKKTRIPVQAESAESSSSEVANELDFVFDGESEAQPEPVVPEFQHKDFENSMAGNMRSINTHDMLDVRQQAEFFMTLGQYEDAIDMLQNSIQQSEAANPMVYLDLLKMLHTLSRKTEFDSTRKNFNRIFSGRVPPYIAFNEPSKGLESYSDLCERIVPSWPHKPAIEFIEQCLVRGTMHIAAGRIELEAFRDLLMLHDIAKQADETGDSQNYVFSAAKSDMDSMPDFADSEPMMLDMPQILPEEAPSISSDLLLPPTFEAQPAFDVDLDLSEPKDNLIDFDPSIFSLDLPESKP